MRELQLRGGLRVGRINTSAPLVKLTVNHQELEIAAGLSGHFVFRPEDIIRLEPQTIFPVLGKRVKIVHRNPDYPADILFLTFRDPETLITDIRKTGFLAGANPELSANDERILEKQKSASGFPFKTLFFVGMVLLYNLGPLYYLISSGGDLRMEKVGPYFSLGGLLLVTIGIGLLLSEPLRHWAFRAGTPRKRMNTYIYVVIVIGLWAALINGIAFGSLTAG
ncbi:hypothetical protein [Lewinella sp. W8]|uniref:hypothetical protein n=1 Tax=Lewinella sp. W8 TaxID=2528208 RepID=UPI0010686B88|nr:hypothetical protein [Lewinella sp. W8]MTB52658.1 hypothetical protein [Lewinella sp. W8]